MGLVRTIGVVRATSSNKDKERPTYKRYYKATQAAYYRLLSIVPYGPYINSIKEDNIIVTTIREGIEISSNLGSKGETNNSKEE